MPSYLAFAGRAWQVNAGSHPCHWVGEFPSLEEAQQAFVMEGFVELNPTSGRRRWRGYLRKPGMIVQIEQSCADTIVVRKSA